MTPENDKNRAADKIREEETSPNKTTEELKNEEAKSVESNEKTKP